MKLKILIFLLTQIIFTKADLNDIQKLDINNRLDSITNNLLASTRNTPFWHSHKLNSGRHNREELQITKLILDETFQYGSEIERWYSFKIGIRQYAIGLCNYGLNVLLFSGNGTVIKSLKQKTEKTPKTLTNTLKWNSQTRQMELIVACLTYDPGNPYKIEWFQLKNNTLLESLWVWEFGKLILEIEIIERDQIKNLIVLNQETSMKNSLDIFQFDFDDSNNYWITQHIPLSSETEKFTINTVNENFYLTLQHKSTESISIYKLSQYGTFEPFENITVSQLQTIESFQLNNRNYLFVGGYDLTLYEITANDNLEKIILDDSIQFGVVNYILPIKVTTYRDDIIFLIEHTIDYGTHKSNIVETVYYHDGTFKKHEEIVCVYYDMARFGLSCLIDEDTEWGIAGSISLAFPHLNVSKVLLPRKSRNSEVFILEAKLNVLPNPVENDIRNFLELKQSIMELYEEQQKFITELENRVNDTKKLPTSPPERLNQNIPDKIKPKFHLNTILQQIQEIQTTIESLKPLVANKTDRYLHESLEFSNGLEVQGTLKIENLFVDHLNGHPVDDILSNTIRKDQKIDLVKGQKLFTNLTLDHVHFIQVNSLPADAIAFKNGGDIEIDGNLLFTNNVTVLKDVHLAQDGRPNVNNVVLKQDILQKDKFFNGKLTLNTLNISQNVLTNLLNRGPVPNSLANHFQQASHIPENGKVFCNTLQVAGSVDVFKVNGIILDDLLSRIYLRNQPKTFKNPIHIRGNIFTQSNISLTHLNEYDFRKDFVFATGSPYTIINGSKNFSTSITAVNATVRHKIDDVDLNTVILLGSNEEFENDFIFDNLEVTEIFQVDGIINGTNLPNFLPNPTLRESHDIKSNVIFKRLQVDGEIIVEDTVNGSTWDEYLGDIVYKDEVNPEINSIKTFTKPVTILENLQVTSNMLNAQNISEITNKAIDSSITQNMINGIVTIENLELSGLFDHINMTELNEQAVKLTGDQYVTSEIIFDELNPNVDDIMAVDLEIMDTLNGIPFAEFESFVIGPKLVHNLTADNITVDGNVIWMNNAIDYKDLVSEYIEAKYKYRTANVRNLEVETINTVPISELNTMFVDLRQFENDLKQGLVPIREIFVNGSIRTSFVNGINLQEILKNAIYAHKLNTNLPNVEFLDEIITETFQIENWNGHNFNAFLSDLIKKLENNIYISGEKTFARGFHVQENIETEHINGVSVSDLIRNDATHQIFSGPLKIVGDVEIEHDLNLNGSLNELEFSDVQNYISEDEFGNLIINGDVQFAETSQIRKLNHVNYLNDIHLPSFLKKMITKGSHMEISGSFTFLNKVNFEDNLVILNQYNDIPSVSNMMSNIVLLNQDNHLNTHVTFAKDTFVENCVKVRNNFDTKYMDGININDWQSNAIDLRYESFIPGQRIFKNVLLAKDLYTETLNDISIDSLITLGLPQNIDATLEFRQIAIFGQKNIPVQNYVNNFVLPVEYDNTVKKTDRNVVIEAETIFHVPIHINENLYTVHPINENTVDLAKIVTVDTDQELVGQYVFEKVKLRNDLIAAAIIDFDLEKLQTKGVRLDEDQTIYGNWIIDGNVTFHEHILGDGFISNFNLRRYVQDKNSIMASRSQFETNYNQFFQNACDNVDLLYSCARKQVYKFEYFQIAQVIDEDRKVESIHHFVVGSNHYLLVSYTQMCQATLYQWSPRYQRFAQLQTINLSPLQQWIHVPTKSYQYFVSKSQIENERYNEDCMHYGTNLWILEDLELSHKYRLQNVTMLNQPVMVEPNFASVFYGLQNNIVYEFDVNDLVRGKRSNAGLNHTRQWRINADGPLTFVPNNIGLDVSITDGGNIYTLKKPEKSLLKSRNRVQTSDEMDENLNNFTLSSIKLDQLPIVNYNDIIPIEIRSKRDVQKRFVAVPIHEKTEIKGTLDFIKIYENDFNGNLFHKVATYKPTHLNTMGVGGPEDGETLLLFLEDRKQIQVFQYKGIEGFRQFNDYPRTIKLPGSILKVIQLPVEFNQILQNYLLLVDNSAVTVIETIVAGDKFQKDAQIKCPDYLNNDK